MDAPRAEKVFEIQDALMGLRQRKWAEGARLQLIESLGGKCVLCPEKRPHKLEFDHINGRDWKPREISSEGRMCRYRAEAKANLIRLLCGKCNKKERHKCPTCKRHIPTGGVCPEHPF